MSSIPWQAQKKCWKTHHQTQKDSGLSNVDKRSLVVEACVFERSADRRGSRSKVLAVPQTWAARSVQGGKKRDLRWSRDALQRLPRRGSTIINRFNSALNTRCIRGAERSQIILEIIVLPMLSVGGKDCVVFKDGRKTPNFGKIIRKHIFGKKGQKSKKMNSVFGEQRVRRCRWRRNGRRRSVDPIIVSDRPSCAVQCSVVFLSVKHW